MVWLNYKSPKGSALGDITAAALKSIEHGLVWPGSTANVQSHTARLDLQKPRGLPPPPSATFLLRCSYDVSTVQHYPATKPALCCSPRLFLLCWPSHLPAGVFGWVLPASYLFGSARSDFLHPPGSQLARHYHRTTPEARGMGFYNAFPSEG